MTATNKQMQQICPELRLISWKLLKPPKKHERVIDSWRCAILKVMYEEIYSNVYLLEVSESRIEWQNG